MLKQSELSEEDQAEAFRRADALFRAESEQAQTARSAAQAAEELGIPQEYLDRAAAQLHAEKAEKIKAQNQKRRVLIAVGAALVPATLAIFLMTRITAPPPPAVVAAQPLVAPFTLSLNATDDATTSLKNARGSMTSTNNRYQLKIDGFQPQSGNYQANLGFPISSSLSGYETVSFSIQGSGISRVRLDLRDGGGVRWNSRPISLSSESQRVTVPLSELIRQMRVGESWQAAPGGGPDGVKSLVFKFGKEINPPEAKGTVTISDVQFQ
jgi:hypothetical protein